VNGNLLEAKTRSAELRDVRPDDFVRFLEYAYRGDYTVPPWEQDKPLQDPSDDEEVAADKPAAESEPPIEEAAAESIAAGETATEAQLREFWASSKKNEKKKKRDKTTLRSRFQKRTYIDGITPSSQIIEGFRPKSNSAPDQDFRPVFLAHARLYIFADMRLIYPLKKLILHKLHKTLMEFELYHQRVRDIVELARFAYEHGPDRSEAGTANELRRMVVAYMACEVDIIGEREEFKALLEDGGEFVSDFWRIVTRCLV
jgi:hypothetical protein